MRPACSYIFRMSENTPTPSKPVTAGLAIIGNEILSGRTRDANLQYLGDELNKLGIRMMEVRIVSDIPDAIIEAVNTLRARYDYVFTTGGIGPTHDDITSECIARAFDIDVPVFVADINLDVLHAGKKAKFAPLAEFPGVERDLVFLLDKSAFVRDAGSDAIVQTVNKAGGKLLTETRIFDLYEGKGVPEDKVSVGVRFILQDASRTLTQQDSDAASAAIIAAMDKRFGAALRG